MPRHSRLLLQQHHARARHDGAPALVRFDPPGDQLEQRRLAGPVAPDQRQPVARLDMDVEAAEQPPRSLDEAEIFICEDWAAMRAPLGRAGDRASWRLNDRCLTGKHSQAVQARLPMRDAMKMLVPLALSAPAALGPVSAPAEPAQRRDQQEAFDQLRKGRIMPLRDSSARAAACMAGSQYLGVELDPAAPVFTRSSSCVRELSSGSMSMAGPARSSARTEIERHYGAV